MEKNKPHNPFLIAGYYSPEYFCDRETETAKMISSLENDRNISLMSPRRFGKTGLIQHVFYKISEKDNDAICIYFDIYSTQNLNDFVKIFAESVLGKAENGVERAMKKFAAVFKTFRPVFSYDTLSGQPELSVKIEPEAADQSLRELFLYLKQSNKRCYIAIDEFQQISAYQEKGAEALLRSYIQFLPNVKFIFSGSRQHLMNEMFLSAKRPFYQSTQIMPLAAIDKDKYFQFAASHFQKNEYILSKECFEQIYSQFEGHTWSIQRVFNELYARSAKGGSVDVFRFLETVAGIAKIYEPTYQSWMANLTERQKEVLIAIAKDNDVTEITSADFIRRHGLQSASSVQSSVKQLVAKELIVKTQGSYTVIDHFFLIWLRMFYGSGIVNELS